MRRISTLLIGTLLLSTMSACNPTWTKDGKPNDHSMPLPPDAKAPTQAGTSSGQTKP